MDDTSPPIDETRIRLAVQKKGRLADSTFELLAQCGLKVRFGKSQLFARIRELPIDVLLVRDDDIPELVASGAADAGIVGANVYSEDQLDRADRSAAVIKELGFSRCRLCIAVETGVAYPGPSYFRGKRIATSYPHLTADWLRKKGVEDVEIVMMHGAHEIAPRLGHAHAICDIVQTGTTLDQNGLKVAETIFSSQALLIARPDAPQEKSALIDDLAARMAAAMASRDAKYVMMNAPRSAIADIRKVLPGKDAPTILALAGSEEMVAIHVVCKEEVLWDQLEELKGLGASAILVLDIDKMLS